jgi:hypothetical protein
MNGITLKPPAEALEAARASVLQRLGVGVVVVEDEATAKQEMVAMLAETAVIGLDIETTPRWVYRAEAEAALDPIKARQSIALARAVQTNGAIMAHASRRAPFRSRPLGLFTSFEA